MEPTLAITQGDPHGIGPEVLLRALADGAAGGSRVVVLGDRDVIERTALELGLPIPAGVRTSPDAESQSGSESALWALEEACRLANAGEVDAIVTAPITKSDLARVGFAFPGQTEFLGARLGCNTPTMMLAGATLRVSLVTTHMPLSAVPAAVTTQRVEETIRRTHAGLSQWFGIDAPSIAVLGLNPHAGEAGLLGHEDDDVVRPAIEACRESGIHCDGPVPADGSFAPRIRTRYDAFVAMYHDQGLTALKAVEGGGAVNLTLGLPVPRTSPDHGSARDIAGRGLADATSMTAALELAVAAASVPTASSGRGNPSAAVWASAD